MLNLWKKIQEKGRVQSPKKDVSVSTLDPRYDGPLKSFLLKDSDIIPLEKCRLAPNDLDDIYENKSVYLYFKYFLESKMAVDVLRLYNSLTHVNNQSWRSNDAHFDCIISQEGVDNGDDAGTNIDTRVIHDALLRLPTEIRTKITHADSRMVDDTSTVDISSLESVLRGALLEYWTEFRRSELYFRYQVELLTSRSITLGDILCHETALSYFMQFLEMEGCSNVVEFWLAVTNFRQFVQNSTQSNQADLDQILNDAISIYEKYLSLLATCPLGFNDSIRCAVEEAICDETKGPHADSFASAINTVLAFLRTNYLVPYLSSQHYVHMLSDMIRHTSSIVNHSPTSSVSEYSIDSSKKGFLAKLDTDSIWDRRKRSGLSFGHIDQLGRFQRDIEPDPDRSHESRISKMMKKWVQRSANRVEEEMAWQVAEMVVKDITDLTMGNNLENYEPENYVCNKTYK